MPQSEFAYDASYVKLREANITYALPAKLLGSVKKYIKGVDISLIGRNLWLIHKNLPYADPGKKIYLPVMYRASRAAPTPHPATLVQTLR